MITNLQHNLVGTSLKLLPAEANKSFFATPPAKAKDG